MQKEVLINAIKKAFDGVEQPAELTLHVAEAMDRYEYDSAKYRELDYRGDWADVPDKHLENCQNAFSFLDKVGMRYYLPAYMVWHLKNKKSEDDLYHLLNVLDPCLDEEKLAKYFQERFSLFSSEQLKVCAMFIKYYLNNYTDGEFFSEIYDNYWKQYF